MAKKLVLTILFFCLLPFFIANAEEKFPFLAEVSVESVNVRAGQNTNFEKLCRLSRGSEVIVVGKSFDWYKIKLPAEAKSFISQDFVSMIDEHTAEITGHRVNIRAGAGPNFVSLGQLVQGARVHVVQKINGWIQIEAVEGTFGWVSVQFLKFKSVQIPETVTAKIVPESARKTINTSAPTVETAAKPEIGNNPPAPTPEPESNLTIVGHLVHFSDPSFHFKYKLMTQDGTVYNIENTNDVFEQFVNAQVTVEGVLKKSLPDWANPSALDVSKIQLVL